MLAMKCVWCGLNCQMWAGTGRHEVMQYASKLLEGSSTADVAREHDAIQNCSEAASNAADVTPAADGVAAQTNRPGQFVMDEKRVSNQLLRTRLGVTLRFPTYREGMQGIHEGNQTPFD